MKNKKFQASWAFPLLLHFLLLKPSHGLFSPFPNIQRPFPSLGQAESEMEQGEGCSCVSLGSGRFPQILPQPDPIFWVGKLIAEG